MPDQADAGGRAAHSIGLNSDGTVAAVVLSDKEGASSEVWMIDLTTFTAIDTDTSTKDPDPVALTSTGDAEHVVWSADDTVIAVGENRYKEGSGDAQISFIDTSTYAITNVTPSGGGESAGVMAQHDNVLYYASRNDSKAGVTLFDMATRAETAVSTGLDDARGVVIDPIGGRYWAIEYNDAQPRDLDTNALIDASGGASKETYIDLPEQFRAHFMVISPF